MLYHHPCGTCIINWIRRTHALSNIRTRFYPWTSNLVPCPNESIDSSGIFFHENSPLWMFFFVCFSKCSSYRKFSIFFFGSQFIKFAIRIYEPSFFQTNFFQQTTSRHEIRKWLSLSIFSAVVHGAQCQKTVRITFIRTMNIILTCKRYEDET